MNPNIKPQRTDRKSKMLYHHQAEITPEMYDGFHTHI